MSIKNWIEELERVENEIKRNSGRNKNLRLRVNELRIQISDYLKEKDQPGLKYNGKAIILEKTEKRPIKKKKDKDASILEFFKKLGVNNPENAYSELLNVQRRSPVEQKKLKIKKFDK